MGEEVNFGGFTIIEEGETLVGKTDRDMELKELKEIVRGAAGCMAADFDVKQKDGFTNIVTSSDLAVQEYLRRHLSEAMPGCGFLCEEEDRHDLNHEAVWIIDPIDGTANYSRGIAQCAIAVGLRLRGEMRLGVVYLPRTGEMFSAELGRGAWLNDKPIHVSDRPFADSILCTALPVYHKEYSDQCAVAILEAFKQCNDLRRFGAAAPELCYVAMGRVDLYFEYQLSPWGFAAASLVLTEAGGSISLPNGQPLDMLQPSGVIAANTSANLSRLQSIINAAGIS